MANFDNSDCCDSVLRLLKLPSPAEYCLDYDSRYEEEASLVRQDTISIGCSLLKTEGVWTKSEELETKTTVQKLRMPATDWSRSQEVGSKAYGGEVRMAESYGSDNQSVGTKADAEKLQSITVTRKSRTKAPIRKSPTKTAPEKLQTKAKCSRMLKLSQAEMVHCLQKWKHPTNETLFWPVPIKEVDIYKLRPEDLMPGTGGSSMFYFFSTTKYKGLKKPTRSRITEGECRWKQQGRMFPIKENGRLIAYKFYLSYIPLKKGNCKKKLPSSLDGTRKASLTDLPSGSTRKKCVSWTMEEIGLVDDVELEKRTLREGETPSQFPVICRILGKVDGRPALGRKKTRRVPLVQ